MVRVNIPVVYEDAWSLVVNKPSGLLTIPTPKRERRTLTSILNEDLKDKGFTYRLHPCHRLDRETSGLVIYAKGKSAQEKITELFRQRKIKKTYVALVKGFPPSRNGEIKTPIGGLGAITRYKITQQRSGFSVIEITPLTGRTNQIRIHLKQLGCPILGETKFAFRRDFKIKAKRLCLHARDLEFIHPFTNRPISLRAELPDELKGFLEQYP